MLHLFRNNGPFTILILFIGALLLKLQPLLHPLSPDAMPYHLVFAGLLKFFNNVLHFGAFSFTLLNVVLVFLQAMYINFIVAKYKLLPKVTYFPALAYILITSINPTFNYFSELMLINWLLLIALDIMLSFSQSLQPRKQIFNAGFVICLPFIIQFPAIGFVLLFFMALLLLRPFNIGEWVVGILGYLTPIYFFIGILFLVGQFSLLKQLPEIGFAIPKTMLRPVYLFSSIIGLIILLAAGFIGIQQQVAKMTIAVRRSWILMFLYLIVAVLTTFVSSSAINAEWVLVMPPLAIIIAHAFYVEKTKRFSNFIFYFSLVFVIFCQLAINK